MEMIIALIQVLHLYASMNNSYCTKYVYTIMIFGVDQHCSSSYLGIIDPQ
jgi:hypothetical protein